MDRLRLRPATSTVSSTYKGEGFDKSNCSLAAQWTPYYNASASALVGSYESMQDETVPGFHKLSKEGAVFMNSMFKQKLVISNGVGNSTGEFQDVNPVCTGVDKYYPKDRFTETGNYTGGRQRSGFAFTTFPDGSLVPPISYIPNSEMANAITEASTACQNQRGRSKSNLFEALAELDKSAGMLSQALLNVSQFLGKNQGLVSRAQAASSAYLMYRYGLKPLISDVEAAREGMKKAVGRVRITSRGSVGLSAPPVTFTSPGGLYGVWSFTRRFTISESCEIRIMSLDEVEASFGFNVGFSAKGLLTLPWELLPYSFVLDWFANIGDFIGACTPVAGLHQLGSCTVVKRKFQSIYSEESMTLVSPALRSVVTNPQPGSCNYLYESTSRNPGIVAPGLVIKSDFRFSNLTRASDALALLMQKLKR